MIIYARSKYIATALSLFSIILIFTAINILYVYYDKSSEILSTKILLVLGLSVILSGVAGFWSVSLSRNLEKARVQRRVFLIYDREDTLAARKLSGDLAANGFKPWLDVEEILPGEVWSRSIRKALEESDAAVVLISKNSVKSKSVQKELEIALETLRGSEKNLSPVIPVRLDDSDIPSRLAHINAVRLNDDSDTERLVHALGRLTRRET